MRGPLLLSVIVAVALVPELSTAGAESGDGAERKVIIELSEPPVAEIRRQGGDEARGRSIAAAQRARVRQRIVALENQKRAARGLPAGAEAAIIGHEYGIVLNGFAARLSAEAIATLRTDPEVERISPDLPVRVNLSESVPLVRAPELWSFSTPAYRGQGEKIAIIDTGVDYRHPYLGDCGEVGIGPGCKVVGGYNFVPGAPNPQNPIDDHGHGTHVASIAAGNGALLGVAPDAQILAYKVLDALGRSHDSPVIAGIERAISDGATIINMSLGGCCDEIDPLARATNNAAAMGVLSVAAAGNAGPGYYSAHSPGIAQDALTVGNSDKQDVLYNGPSPSSRGPSPYFGFIKPELLAPGTNICAARFTHPTAPPPQPLPSLCPDQEPAHLRASGTSMAAPHVAGAAALLRGWHRLRGVNLSPAELKAAIQHSTVPRLLLPADPVTGLPLDVVTAGTGRLDVRSMIDVQTILTPSPVNFGNNPNGASTWQAAADVRVRNLGSASKTYSLSVTGFPAGVTHTLSPSSLSVPAGSSRTTRITLQVDGSQVPDTLAPPHLHAGTLTAQVSGSSERQSVPLGFAKRRPPANDSCSNATVVTDTPFHDAVDTWVATIGPEDPPAVCGAGRNGATVWYRFTAPCSGMVTAYTFAPPNVITNYPNTLTAFTGTCGSFEPIACAESSIISDGPFILLPFPAYLEVEVERGITYFFQVADPVSIRGGNLGFTLSFASYGVGDTCDSCVGRPDPSQCAGDCDCDQNVTAEELDLTIDTALGREDLADCSRADCDGDGVVAVSEVFRAIYNT